MVLLGDEAHVEVLFGPFGDSANLDIDRCMVCAKRTIGLEKSFWTHPMVLLGDEAKVEAHFGPFEDSANLDADRCMVLPRTYPRLRNHFGCAQLNSYVTWVMSNLVSIRLETVLASMQDRCTVCAKHTMAQKIVLYATDGTPWRRGSSGSSFQSVWR